MIKLLFVDMNASLSLVRLPKLFENEGVESYGLAPQGQILLKTNALKNRFEFPADALTLSRRQLVNSLAQVCRACDPDLLIMNDENMIRNLLAVRRNLRANKNEMRPIQKQLSTLLEDSLMAEDELYQRNNIMEQARAAGFPIAEGFAVTSPKDILQRAEQLNFSGFLKLNYIAGGYGVFHLTSRASLEKTLAEFPEAVKLFRSSSPALVQREVDGVEHNICFAAWQGQLLGYYVFRPLEKLKKYGLVSVVAGAHRPGWEAPIAKLVRQTGFSGFGGLDVFESSGAALPHVVEVNVRPTQSLQLDSHMGGNLIALFCQALRTGQAPEGPVHHPDTDRELAFFPYEVKRDPASPYLARIPMNTPWDDLPLLRSFLSDNSGN